MQVYFMKILKDVEMTMLIVLEQEAVYAGKSSDNGMRKEAA